MMQVAVTQATCVGLRLLQPFTDIGLRAISTSGNELKAVLAEKIPAQQEQLKALKKTHGSKILGEVTTNMVLGGMRGITGLLWETSLLDPVEGIRFRGYSIPELQEKLPAAKNGSEMLPEGLLWLLMTGDLPTQQQAAAVTAELQHRAQSWPSHIERMLDALPRDTHPMTQFSMAILSMQPSSHFAAAYSKGVHKSKYWEPVYEDAMNLIAHLPRIAATVYRKTYHGGKLIAPHSNLDWAANLSYMMGFDSEPAYELMRLYQSIHADHEGGNVSAHTAHVVASALSDPYFSYAAGMTGLAGPLHGLANQEVLLWMTKLTEDLNTNTPSKEQVTQYVWDTLKGGKVVPGYGHAVLRKTDPRYTAQMVFAEKHLPQDPMFKLVKTLYEVVPDVLSQTGKVQNPWPNVDAHSGVLLQHFGITQHNYYTVLFGVSRALGVLSQNVWSRALGLPIERPKSITMAALNKKFEQKA